MMYRDDYIRRYILDNSDHIDNTICQLSLIFDVWQQSSVLAEDSSMMNTLVLFGKFLSLNIMCGPFTKQKKIASITLFLLFLLS